MFALNTVMGRKVNEVRVAYEHETRNRNPNGAGQQTILIGPGIIGERYYLPITGTNANSRSAMASHIPSESTTSNSAVT